MEETTIEILIPTGTFILGACFQYWMSKSNQKKKREQDAVIQISKSTNQWYDQLNHILCSGKSLHIHGEIKAASYATNRLILPTLIQSRSVLEGKKKYGELLRLFDSFIEIVTDPELDGELQDEIAKDHMLRCLPTDNLNLEILNRLDAIVQKIARESGTLLR